MRLEKEMQNMVDEYKKEFAGWWLWVLLLFVISIPVFWGLSAAGLFGGTVLERVIFEQSYQKKAGDKTKLRIFEAQKFSIQRRLRTPNLTAEQITDLEAQLSAIEIQISTVKGD